MRWCQDNLGPSSNSISEFWVKRKEGKSEPSCVDWQVVLLDFFFKTAAERLKTKRAVRHICIMVGRMVGNMWNKNLTS